MKIWTWVAVAVGVVWLWSQRGSATTPPSIPPQPPSEPVTASFYGPGFDGKLTANGEVFDQWAMTAAHRTLTFGTNVKVTDVDNGRSVTVRINDRGPFTKKNGVYAREIDLSAGAAAAIGLDIQKGLARVLLEIV